MDAYKEALKNATTVRWKTVPCSQENCWCSPIVPETPLTFEYEDITEQIYIAGEGELAKEIAEYIVKIHNERLSGKRI